MGLYVELKRGEQLFLGECSVACEEERVRLHIRGNARLLREREMITAEEATSPAKRLALLLQQTYLSDKWSELHPIYLMLAQDVLRCTPNLSPFLAEIATTIEAGEHFKALKVAQKLIKAEDDTAGVPQPGRKQSAI